MARGFVAVLVTLVLYPLDADGMPASDGCSRCATRRAHRNHRTWVDGTESLLPAARIVTFVRVSAPTERHPDAVAAVSRTHDQLLAIVADVVGDPGRAGPIGALLMTSVQGIVAMENSGRLTPEKWHVTGDELLPIRSGRSAARTDTVVYRGSGINQQGLQRRTPQIRARVEHATARLKTYEILRDHRRADHILAVTAAGIAHLHGIAMAA